MQISSDPAGDNNSCFIAFYVLPVFQVLLLSLPVPVSVLPVHFLSDADPEHARLYQQNAAAYEEKLAVLDQEYQTTVEQSQSKTLLFADRFPFRYLTDDYGLTYYAAFTGCSAETDASFETITFLAGKLDELKLPVVLTIENSDQKVAKAVIENTKTKDQKILTLNSMQSVTTQDVEEGTTYLSIMENNLKILKEAL